MLDFWVKEQFYLVLDCEAGSLGFINNGKWLGEAHTGLKVSDPESLLFDYR